MILGLSDGGVPGAALVVDDRLVAADESPARRPGDAVDPFESAERVLATAGVRASEVDAVALAGRYSPPLAVRRRPHLQRLARDPFGQARALGTRWERFLRGTGLGAADADRAREWLAATLAPRGLRPRRVTLVDAHRALASAAYRLQPADRATVLVVHPRGDGLFASVHRAAGGQLDRTFGDRATTGVHLFVPRALDALGAADPGALEAVAEGEGSVDLDEVFSFSGRFEARPGPERRRDAPWALLAQDRPDGAASVLRQLRRHLGAFLRAHHVDGKPLLAGALLADPAWLGDALPDGVGLGAWRGDRALAVGAAADLAGLVPHAAAIDLGPDAGASDVPADDAATVIARGDPWLRCVGRAGPGALAARHRGIWVRADDPDQVTRLRRALELPADARPIRLRATPPPGLPAALVEAWETGVTVRGQPCVGPAGDGAVAARLAALARRGVDEVAVWPLARRDRPAVSAAADVDELAAAAGVAVVEHGPRRVAR